MKKILVIDDEADYREVLTDYLSDSGYVLLEAEDGPQGLALLEAEDPDLVILDMRMPEMDGLEVLSEMRKKGVRAETIVLSGICEESTEQSALKLGARRYLTKPVNLEYLTQDCIPAALA